MNNSNNRIFRTRTSAVISTEYWTVKDLELESR